VKVNLCCVDGDRAIVATEDAVFFVSPNTAHTFVDVGFEVDFAGRLIWACEAGKEYWTKMGFVTCMLLD
jgi:hypothetical protein